MFSKTGRSTMSVLGWDSTHGGLPSVPLEADEGCTGAGVSTAGGIPEVVQGKEAAEEETEAGSREADGANSTWSLLVAGTDRPSGL